MGSAGRRVLPRFFSPFLKKFLKCPSFVTIQPDFFVEIKGTSDIYSSSKSLMIILPFMEEAICYCNNAKLTIESFSYLGQLNNYITLLIQPVRKFFRAGRSCFYSLFSL